MDDNSSEPLDLWEQWIPKKFDDKAPKLVKDDLAWTGVKAAGTRPGMPCT